MKTALFGIIVAAAIATPATAAELSYHIINLRSGGGPSGTFQIPSAEVCKTVLKSMTDFWGPMGYVVIVDCKG